MTGRGRPSAAAIQRKQHTNDSFLSKLQMLRSFVPSDVEESDLSACLRQCACNVELAAEKLMTGQFQRQTSTFFGMSTSSITTGKQKANIQNDSKPAAKRPKLEIGKPKASNAAKKPAAASSTSFLSAKKKAPPSKPKSLARVTPSPDSSSHRNDSHLLLCQRWVVGTCTTKFGAADYQENLEVSHSLQGPPMVRFKGSRIEGTLQSNLAALLTPLLRCGDDEDDATPLLVIEAEALMELRGLAIGAEVPVSLKIYLENARAFFGVFGSVGDKEHAASAASQFFGAQKKKAPSEKSRKKKAMPVVEAAFGLLQWAEYGEQYHFEPPKEKEESMSESGNDEDEDGAVMGATQLESEATGAEEEEATEWAKNLVDEAASSVEAALPEASDPDGFKDGVVLRPYQKQALHWMLNRESGDEHREAMEKELELLSELARNAAQATPSVPPSNMKSPIMCEVGPVLVSNEAAEKSQTIDGEINPVKHPLWHRRFLATPDMGQAISFYVNELIGVASAEPPNPPSHCVGGILADAMGLGKTVELLALILKSKENGDTATDGTTLVVAPLSLISQWEEELATKTALTHRVYYGDSAKGSLHAGTFKNVDVVVTTYGTLQAELQLSKKKASVAGILEYEWTRVILDEAHCIKNSSTLVSRACCMLKAEKRWCVTGTPIQNALQDIYAQLKFLRHEPWCEAGFWKAAITNAAQPEKHDGGEGAASAHSVETPSEVSVDNAAQSRVRRLLAPLILRRAKDSLDKDGKPILTLPPVETVTVKVELSPAERDFYSSLMSRSQSVFEGFLKDGTATKSWFAIFSLLHRLRQACDHVALTVKSHMEDSDWNTSTTSAESPDNKSAESSPAKKKSPASKDAVDDAFLDGLLKKFNSKQQEKENLELSQEDAGSMDTEMKYASQVAHALDDVVKAGATHVEDECALCLDAPRINDAVLTPCAHVFCRECLVKMLRESAQQKADAARNDDSDDNETDGPHRTLQKTLECPDGECPICKEPIEAKRIIALSSEGGRTTSCFLTDTKNTTHSVRLTTEAPKNAVDNVARQTLENALRGADSSKLKAVIEELHNVWEKDPGSKVLIFSQFLGFLDLMESSLRKQGIPFGRLDGKLSLKERVSVLEKFRDATTTTLASTTDERAKNRGSVLLISMKAGGVGINLTAASSVFVVDPWWNSAVEDQCVNRVHRIGQTAEMVRVRKFVVADSVEERIVSLQRRKQDMASVVLSDGSVGEASNPNSRPTLDDLKLLFRG